MTEQETQTRRLFFALPLADQLKQSIDEWRQENLPANLGKPVSPDNFHFTLVFLGNCTDSQTQELVDEVKNIQVKSFSLKLAKLGRFGKARITHLAPLNIPEELTHLVSQLRLIASHAGFDSFGTFKPHLTLFRKSVTPPHIKGEIDFICQFDSFHLFESVSVPGGVKYMSLAQWALK